MPFGHVIGISRTTSPKVQRFVRCYISSVENGHIAPAIETLEKMARGLEVSLCQLFHYDDKTPECLFQTITGLTRFPYPELGYSPASYLTRCGYAHIGAGALGSL